MRGIGRASPAEPEDPARIRGRGEHQEGPGQVRNSHRPESRIGTARRTRLDKCGPGRAGSSREEAGVPNPAGAGDLSQQKVA